MMGAISETILNTPDDNSNWAKKSQVPIGQPRRIIVGEGHEPGALGNG
jgi:hypothetical protein